MLKRDAQKALGGTVKLADGLGLTHPSVCAMPEVLSLAHADRVRGALVRLRWPEPPKKLPKNPRRALEVLDAYLEQIQAVVPKHLRNDDQDTARLAEQLREQEQGPLAA